MVVIMNQEIERIIEEEINLILNTNKVLSIGYFENIVYSNIAIAIKLDIEQLKNRLREQKKIIFINSQEEEIISKDYFLKYVEKNKDNDLHQLLYLEYFSNGEVDYDWIIEKYVKEKEDSSNDKDVFQGNNEIRVEEEEKIAVFLCLKSEENFFKKIDRNIKLKNWCLENEIIINGDVSQDSLKKSTLIEFKVREIMDFDKELLPLVLGESTIDEITNKLEEKLLETKLSFYNELLNIISAKDDLSQNIIRENNEQYSNNQKKESDLISLNGCSDILLKELAMEINKTKEVIDFNILESHKVYRKYLSKKEEILKIINSENIFYQISSKRYFLKELLITKIFENFEENSEVSFELIEKKVREILKIKGYNRRNLLELFNDLNIEFLYNKVKIIKRDKLQENFKKYFNDNESFYTDFFLDGHSEINLQELSYNIEDKDSFILRVISHPKVGYIEEKLLKKDRLDLNDFFRKAHIYLDYINTKDWILNYKNSIESIFKIKSKGLAIKEIIEILGYQNREEIDERKVKEILEHKEFLKISKDVYVLSSFKGKKKEYLGSFKDELDNLYQELGEREKLICETRIFSEISMTLEEVGTKLGVTRERIRQQEKKIIGKLSFYKHNFIPYLKEVSSYFNKNSISSFEEFWINEEMKKIFYNVEVSTILKIYNFYSKIKIYSLYDKYLSFYTNDYILEYLFKKFKEDKIFEYEELEKVFKELKIDNILFIEDFFLENPSIVRYKDKILLKRTRWVISDRARLILDYLGEQTHFNKLCDLYNEEYEERIELHPFHARISDCEDIIRTFTGTFALKEWENAQEHIFTKDLTNKFLRENRKPMHFNELIEGVKEKTQASETTIRIFINNKETFQYGFGIWALREWKDDFELAKKYYISQNRIDAGEEEHIHRQYLGKIIKNNRIISLHNATERICTSNVGIYIKQEFFYDLDFSKYKLVDYYGNKYRIRIGIETERYKLYGLKDVLSKIGVLIDQPFYLEYYPQGYIRILTWEQFEFNYIEANFEIVEKAVVKSEEDAEMIDVEENLEEILETIEANEVVSFDKLMEIGIEQGFVYQSDIEKINFYKEIKVKNMNEAYEELYKSEIAVID